MPDVAWGMGGNLARCPTRTTTPGHVRRSCERRDGDLLVLPFTSYRAPTWNGYRKVLDPVGRFLTPTTSPATS